MSAARVVRRGLWLPGLLYLRPERFARDIDLLAPADDTLSVVGALRVARSDRAARRALLELLGAATVASIGWACALSGLLDLVGVPIYWVGVAAGLVGGVAGGGAVGGIFSVSGAIGAVACGVAGAIAGGVADGVAGGVVIANDLVALGVALANFLEVSVGIAGTVAGGAVVGVFVASAVVFTVGLQAEAIGEFAFGPVLGAAGAIAVGLSFGTFFGVVAGVAAGVAWLVASMRLVLAPLDIAVAWWLDRPSHSLAATAVWTRHPARWDPHGCFPLPGLAHVLTGLQRENPVLAIEATRVVAANPARQNAAAAATLLAADRTVARVTTLPALAALAGALQPLLPGDVLPAGEFLPAGEQAELELLSAVSDEAAASGAAESVVDRVEWLRAARRRLGTPDTGSAVIARRRSALTRVVEQALREAEHEQREHEPVPRVYRSSGTPLDPVIAGMPSTFKGRSAVFRGLKETIGPAQRSAVILHGPQRSGKTSLLKQLPRRLGPAVIPVLVDLQGDLGAAESSATLLHGLAGAVVEQARTLRDVGPLPQVSAAALATEPYLAFARWLDELELSLGNRHVLLCLDEYEKLQEQIDGGHLDARIHYLLRSVVQHRRRVTLLLTGVHTLAELPPAWASTLAGATSIELGALERPAAAQLVEQPVADFPRVYSPAAVDAILSATACQPFLLQVLCSVLVDELNERHWRDGDPPVSAQDVTAEHAAVDRAENHFLDLWNNAVPAPARDLVRHLAQHDDVVSADHAGDDLTDAILTLERRRIVTRTPEGHALSVPLFALYVRSRQLMGA